MDKDTLYALVEIFDKRAEYYQDLAFKGESVMNLTHNAQAQAFLEARYMILNLAEKEES